MPGESGLDLRNWAEQVHLEMLPRFLLIAVQHEEEPQVPPSQMVLRNPSVSRSFCGNSLA